MCYYRHVHPVLFKGVRLNELGGHVGALLRTSHSAGPKREMNPLGCQLTLTCQPQDQENFELVARLRAAQSDLQERERRLQQVEDLIAAIGAELRKAQEGPAALLSDLACIRELCARLDTDKELAACALTSKSIELDLVGTAVQFCPPKKKFDYVI